MIDTGVGIGDEDPDQLFERLFRAPTAVAQQTPGAGLGLTIALAIVEAHAGTIEVVSSGHERHHLPDDLPAPAGAAPDADADDGSEEPVARVVHPAQRVVVDDRAGDAAVGGEHPGLRLDLLGGEDAAHRARAADRG